MQNIVLPLSFLLRFLSILIFPFTSNADTVTDTDQINTYWELGEAMFLKNNVDSTSYYFLEAESLAHQNNNTNAVIKSRGLYQKVLIRKRLYKEALKQANENLALCLEVGDSSSLAFTHQNLGMAYFFLMNYQFAVNNFSEGLKIAVKTDDLELQQSLNINLAMIYLTLKEKVKSLKYTRKGHDLAIKNNDPVGIARATLYLALNDILHLNYESAINHCNKVIEMEQEIKGTRQLVTAYLHLGNIYKEKKDLNKALDAYFKGLGNPNIVQFDQIFLYAAISEAYFKKKLYSEAFEYYLICLEAPEVIHNALEMKDIYLLGAKITNKLNLSALNLQYLQKHETLNDSLGKIADVENLNNFEIQLQAAEREKDIAGQKLAIAHKNLELQAKSNWIRLSFAIVVVLLLALIMVGIIYRNKQKAAIEKLQYIQKQNEVNVLHAMMEGEEKERGRLAKELHDGVGGILSATKMHLSILKNQDLIMGNDFNLEQTVKMLEFASQEIRSIAHNLSPNILLLFELDKAIDIFCKSVSNSQLQIECYILGEVSNFTASFKLVVYRLIQELVNNIIKHSKASQGLVQISQYDNLLSITVEDDGVGFDQENSAGLGLTNLRIRVKELNGKININSERGKGTTVYIEFEIQSFRKAPSLGKSLVN